MSAHTPIIAKTNPRRQLAAAALYRDRRVSRNYVRQFRYFQFLTFPSASHSNDVASLCLRVSSRFASVTHSTYSRRWLVLKFSKVFRAFAFFLTPH